MTRRLIRIGLGSIGAIAAFAPALTARADTLPPASLRSYRDKNRVLLVFAPSSADARYRKQAALLRGSTDGLEDRDLVRVNILGNPAAALRKNYGVKSGEFRILLIGKDGHTAYSAGRPVAPSDLFRRIDRMPMRRDEMRQRGR